MDCYAGVADRRTSDVVILGAGFSRAVSAAFPLTDELGELAVGQAQGDGLGSVPHPKFQDGSFETWLSRLAEDQPHLNAEANMANRVVFLRISRAIRSVLAGRQAEALSLPAPNWLYELLSVLHARQAVAVTLNYDNAVECAIDEQFLYAWDPGRWVTTSDILDDLPPPTGTVRDRPAPTFRLLKLHGSLSWFWSPDDVAGTTLQRWVNPGRFGAPEPEDEAERRRILPGREPFIVPPAAVKSGYFQNLIARELWSRAFNVLSTAERIILVGYSLPPGDLTLAGMISDAALGRDVTFEIVNPDPGPVREHLLRAGIHEDQIGHVDEGPDCAERFTRRYCDQQACALIDQIRDWGRADPSRASREGSLVISWVSPETGHPHMVQPVSTVADPDPATGDIILSPAPAGTIVTPRMSQLPELLAKLPAARRLVAHTSDGRYLPIISMWSRAQPGGDALRWISLVPAGRPALTDNPSTGTKRPQ